MTNLNAVAVLRTCKYMYMGYFLLNFLPVPRLSGGTTWKQQLERLLNPPAPTNSSRLHPGSSTSTLGNYPFRVRLRDPNRDGSGGAFVDRREDLGPSTLDHLFEREGNAAWSTV